MAYIQERRDKDGKLISSSIRVHRGRDADGKPLKPWQTKFDVKPGWKEATARKKAEAFAAQFEKECREGTTSDSRIKFAQYADYVIQQKEARGCKHNTIVSYRGFTKRVYPAIGHLKLSEIRASHLNKFYADLQKPGTNMITGEGLSAKTVAEHHRFIRVVLEEAVKEGLLPYNVADRATPPKATNKEPKYFQPEEVAAIRDALKEEPLKWECLTHMLLITGARRGEVLGLKWNDVDFKRNQIYIHRNILYNPDRGIYEDTPKTARSIRYVSLPTETMQLLKVYRAWQSEERLRVGEYYVNQDFVFAQDNGNPMHPDSVTTWLDRFSRRHGLPHISPHMFRHTMASMLYFNGVDSVSISARLGHAQVSTTANIYSHVIEGADQKNAEVLAEVFLKNA